MKPAFFEAVKALFPRSRAFGFFIDNNKRRLIQGLSELPEDVRRDGEAVYGDFFPESTRFPDKWEKIFALYLSEEEYYRRREILAAMWKMISGNESPVFLQSVLQAIDPNFVVVDNIPLIDPRNRESVGAATCDYPPMRCDQDFAKCDFYMGDKDFTPYILRNSIENAYNIPDDPRFWEACFFVCKRIYRNPLGRILYIEPISINVVWKGFIEYLILRIKPVHTIAVLYIKFVEEKKKKND